MSQPSRESGIQTKYIVGSEWVYFKLYSGPVTLERILLQDIYPVAELLFSQNIIDRFFFVRYHDPASHLRLRFRVTSQEHIGNIISRMHRQFAELCEKRIVWKFCLDTYSREVSRYGAGTIEDVEELFSLDSLFVVKTLSAHELNENERLAIGMSYIDKVCSIVFATNTDKVKFIKTISENYLNEFPSAEQVKILLDKKYRENGKAIIAIYNGNSLREINQFYSDPTSLLNRIMDDSRSDYKLQSRLVNSIIHMHFNRVFKADQRKYEALGYYFLSKYLHSRMAKDNKSI